MSPTTRMIACVGSASRDRLREVGLDRLAARDDQILEVARRSGARVELLRCGGRGDIRAGKIGSSEMHRSLAGDVDRQRAAQGIDDLETAEGVGGAVTTTLQG